MAENGDRQPDRRGRSRRPSTSLRNGPRDGDRSGRDRDLLRRAAGGDERALAELFDRYRERLRQMVRLRLDRRLQGRVDPSDVLQDAYLDVAERLPRLRRASPTMPFFLWLRLVTGQRLHASPPPAPRRRDARRRPGGLALPRGAAAGQLGLAGRPALGRLTSASQAAVRAERSSSSRRRSTAWTRSTARSWPCATSRS